MGGNLALQGMEKNIAVIGKARGPRPDLERNGVKVVDDYESFVSYFDKPRVIYVSLPAGPTIDNVQKEVLPYLEKGDVVMDGGNSFYLDSIRREKELFDNGIYFLDCGAMD
jgi:6-phosphogluconate dehydrogenase